MHRLPGLDGKKTLFLPSSPYYLIQWVMLFDIGSKLLIQPYYCIGTGIVETL
jgi:hypothetical protein